MAPNDLTVRLHLCLVRKFRQDAFKNPCILGFTGDILSPKVILVSPGGVMSRLGNFWQVRDP